MSLPALDAAAHMCRRSGWTVSNLRLHNRLFLAALHWEGTRGTPLFAERFHATDFGPLIPGLFKHCSCFGARPIKNIFWKAKPVPADVATFLDDVYDKTKNWTGGQLVAATHRTDGAWAHSYHPGASLPIPLGALQAEYAALRTAQAA